MDVLFVITTTPDPGSAKKMAGELVEKKLAACITIHPRVYSVYRWKGKIERSRESLLFIKTTRAKYPNLEKAVRKAHPYEIPEILAIPVVRGFRLYLSWLKKELS